MVWNSRSINKRRLKKIEFGTKSRFSDPAGSQPVTIGYGVEFGDQNMGYSRSLLVTPMFFQTNLETVLTTSSNVRNVNNIIRFTHRAHRESRLREDCILLLVLSFPQVKSLRSWTSESVPLTTAKMLSGLCSGLVVNRESDPV